MDIFNLEQGVCKKNTVSKDDVRRVVMKFPMYKRREAKIRNSDQTKRREAKIKSSDQTVNVQADLHLCCFMCVNLYCHETALVILYEPLIEKTCLLSHRK